jgi:phosphoglycerate dehydrogenase-like enzyme
MLIALAFEPHRIDLWRPHFAGLASNGHQVIDCTNLATLESARPDIIVGNQSPFIFEYLRSEPPNLQWVHMMPAGVEHVAKVVGGLSRPVRVSNGRGIHGRAIAEYTLAMLLRLALPRPVSGLTALIVGAGAIGSEIAAALRVLGLSTYGVSSSGAPREGFFAKMFDLGDLREALAGVDVVVLALPLTSASRGCFGEAELLAMKPDAILINVARGGIVDEAALCAAMKRGHLSGAAFDVFAVEPLPTDSELWGIPNLLITPHVAARFDGLEAAGADLFRRNLDAFLAGGKLLTEVDVARGY